MKPKILASVIVVLLAFFIEGLLTFVNHPKIEKELQSQIASVIEQQLGGSTVLGETSTVYVSRVIDADTIELSTGEKVRYIGIDAPETKHPTKAVECYGLVASEKNRALVEGKAVRMVKDVSEIDRYGRLLRYVYVANDDGSEVFVNEYLVREGFATASSFPPDIAKQELFFKAEQEARENKKGLWGQGCEDLLY